MVSNFIKEQEYIKAKKKVKEIKGFYIHLFLYIATMPIIVGVNLVFVPGFHWFLVFVTWLGNWYFLSLVSRFWM